MSIICQARDSYQRPLEGLYVTLDLLRSPYTSYFSFTNANGYITEWRHLGSENDTDLEPEGDTNLESEGDAKNIWRMVYFVDASKSDDNSCPIKNPYAGFSILPIANYSVEIVVYGVVLGRSSCR